MLEFAVVKHLKEIRSDIDSEVLTCLIQTLGRCLEVQLLGLNIIRRTKPIEDRHRQADADRGIGRVLVGDNPGTRRGTTEVEVLVQCGVEVREPAEAGSMEFDFALLFFLLFLLKGYVVFLRILDTILKCPSRRQRIILGESRREACEGSEAK